MKLRTTKLLQAVTFSSLAALTSLVACGDDDDDQPGGTAGSAGSNSTAGKAGADSGGSSTAGSSSGGAPTGGKGGTTSVAGNTTAGAAGTSVAGSGGSSVAGSGGSSVAGASGDAGSGGDVGSGGDTSNAGAGGSGEMAGAGGVGGAPDVPPPTPINLSIGKTATASTEEAGNGAAKAIDDDVGTRWCANGGDDGNWISVDLGASHTLTGAQIVWEKGTGTDQPTAKYKYKIELSTDNVTWTPTVDQSANVSPEQTQTHAFAADARYVRVTVLDIVDPGWLWACAMEVRVMGY